MRIDGIDADGAQNCRARLTRQSVCIADPTNPLCSIKSAFICVLSELLLEEHS